MLPLWLEVPALIISLLLGNVFVGWCIHTFAPTASPPRSHCQNPQNPQKHPFGGFGDALEPAASAESEPVVRALPEEPPGKA